MKLIANNIHKKIKGKTILNDISLEMETGNIYGFWGRNGSGKTMLFRALSGLMKIDSGNIYWNEKELHKDFAVLPSQGIVLEHAGSRGKGCRSDRLAVSVLYFREKRRSDGEDCQNRRHSGRHPALYAGLDRALSG